MVVCVHVCLHVSEREGERARGREREVGRLSAVLSGKVGFPFLSIEYHDKGDLRHTREE